MDKLVENRMLHVRFAQMTDELSGAYKHVDSLIAKPSKVQSEHESETETLIQQHNHDMEALKEKLRIEMEAQSIRYYLKLFLCMLNLVYINGDIFR